MFRFCSIRPDPFFILLRSLGHGKRVGSLSSSQEADSRVKFYDKYYKVAEEYDKVFMKKHEEDLNTTLIFVSVLHHEEEPR